MMRAALRVEGWPRGLLIVLCLGRLWAQGPAPDPRTVALAGAITSLSEGIHAVGFNPARLAYSSKDLSISLAGLTIGLENNLLSLENYNLVNGADFIDSTSARFLNKQEFLDGLPSDGLRLKTSLHMPLPGLNWARGTTAFSSDLIIYGNLGLPKALFQLLMEGNPVGQELDLSLDEEIIGVGEWGFSFAVPTGKMAFGVTLKYLQGLFYVGMDPDISSGDFRTDTSGFSGEGRYLLRRAVGGGGFGLDIGFATEESNGYSLGIALINAIGSIRWQGPSITKDLFGDALHEALGFRPNEYLLYTYRVRDVTADAFLQGTDLDSLFENDSFGVLETETGLVAYDSLDSLALAAFVPKPFVTDYPALLRLGVSKRVENFGLISADLVTGFQDRLWSSRGWQLALGAEIDRSPRFPLRMGARFSGAGVQQVGVGFGLHTGILQFDFALALHNGLWIHTTKGVSLAFSLTFVR
ncbi:MAG: hypothetical protein IH971_04370 [Candidatus Marinimicrobia bacterium]|nr:hypothetical protein [Candidatus Neomarinimicrobiota bacterium]